MPAIGIGISPMFQRFVGSSSPQPTQLGVLVENDFNAANWTGNTGSCTFASDGITINFTPGGTGFNNSILYTGYYSAVENFKLDVTATIINSSASFGFSPGIFRQFNALRLLSGTGAPNDGRLDLWAQTAFVAELATPRMTVSDNDVVQMIMEKVDGVLTLTQRNLTIGSIDYVLTYNFNYTYPFTVLSQRLFQIVFSAYGNCNVKVTNYQLSSTDLKNTDYCFVTDSKARYFANTYAGSFYQLLKTANPTKSFSISGGPNMDLTDVVLNLPELLTKNADNYIFYVGCNQYRNNASLIPSQFSAIKAAIDGIGKNCIFVNSTIEGTIGGGIGAVGTNSVNSSAAAVFTTIVDTSSVIIADLAPDEIHLSAGVQQEMADLIQPYLI